MLKIAGKVLDVTSETVNTSTGSFISTTIHLLAGVVVYQVRAGRDFLPSDLPKRDELVELVVVVNAFKTRNGAGYNLTALSRVPAASVPAGQPALAAK